MELRISQISRFIVQSGPIKNSLVAFSTRTIAEARAAEEVEFEGIVGIIIFPSFSFPTISLNQKNKKSSTQLEKLRFFFFLFLFLPRRHKIFVFFTSLEIHLHLLFPSFYIFLSPRKENPIKISAPFLLPTTSVLWLLYCFGVLPFLDWNACF